jgi:hypothetical protein
MAKTLAELHAAEQAAKTAEPAAKPLETPPQPPTPPVEPKEEEDDGLQTAAETEPEAESQSQEEDPVAEFRSTLVESGVPADKVDRLLAKYGGDPAKLIAAGIEAQDAIGARNDRAAFVERLEQHGYSPEAVAMLVQRDWEEKQGKTQAATPATEDDEFDERWVTQGKDGQWYPTASAPPDIGTRWHKQQQKLAQFQLNPEKYIKALLAKQTAAVAQQSQQLTREELAQFQSQAQAEAARAEWVKQNSKLLFVDPADPSKGHTSLTEKIDAIVRKLDPSMPLHERLETAKQWAVGEMTPKQKTTAAKPAARRAPSVASPAAGAFNLEAWAKQYKAANNNRSPSLRELAEAEAAAAGTA